MDKEKDATIRKMKENNENMVRGIVVGKFAMPEKGFLIRDGDANEYLVECSQAIFRSIINNQPQPDQGNVECCEAAFISKNYENIKFNEEIIAYGIIIQNINIGTRRKSNFRKSLAEKSDKVKNRKMILALEVDPTGRIIGNEEGTILNVRQAFGPI